MVYYHFIEVFTMAYIKMQEPCLKAWLIIEIVSG